MLFKNIREDIIKKKTFSQVAKYITNRKTINNVSEYLKEINCSHLNAKIILSSYMIRYQNENVLADTELDDEILLRSIELHKILESDTSNNIKRNKIESYVFLYDKWKQEDAKNQIDDLVEEYYSIDHQIENLKEDKNFEISLIELERIKQKIEKQILLLDSENGIKKLKNAEEKYKQEDNIDEIKKIEKDIRSTLRQTYNSYVRKKLENNDIEVVTKNFKEIRGMLLQCTDDEEIKNKIVDNLYIEYLSDEELYTFLLKVFNYILNFSYEDEKKDVRKSILKLKFNVSKDKEMYEFIPEFMDEAFTRIEHILIMKEIRNKK